MVNSQELKKILANLNNWCFDPLGDLVKAELLKDRVYKDKNHYWFRLYQDDKTNPNWRTEPKIDDFVLDYGDYQEVKEVMIKEIIQNPQDWKIEKESDLVVVKHKSGRKHWKSEFSKGFQKGFKDDEWAKIENALKKSQTPVQQPNSQENDKFPFLSKIDIGGVTFLTLTIFIALIIKRSSKQKKKNK